MPSELVSPFETKFYIILHFQTFPSLCLKRLNVSLPFFSVSSTPVWRLDYTFSKKYPLFANKSIDADRIYKLTEALINNENDMFWKAYAFSRQVNYWPDYYPRAVLYCSMRYVFKNDYEKCLLRMHFEAGALLSSRRSRKWNRFIDKESVNRMLYFSSLCRCLAQNTTGVEADSLSKTKRGLHVFALLLSACATRINKERS